MSGAPSRARTAIGAVLPAVARTGGARGRGGGTARRSRWPAASRPTTGLTSPQCAQAAVRTRAGARLAHAPARCRGTAASRPGRSVRRRAGSRRPTRGRSARRPAARPPAARRAGARQDRRPAPRPAGRSAGRGRGHRVHRGRRPRSRQRPVRRHDVPDQPRPAGSAGSRACRRAAGKLMAGRAAGRHRAPASGHDPGPHRPGPLRRRRAVPAAGRGAVRPAR